MSFPPAYPNNAGIVAVSIAPRVDNEKCWGAGISLARRRWLPPFFKPRAHHRANALSQRRQGRAVCCYIVASTLP
jgi:hypothetical protein